MSNAKLTHLTVVTFSGAHATGKTTLLLDVVERLRREEDVSTFIGRSCSQELFRRMRDGEVKLPRGVQTPDNYDDLNRLHLRAFFQRTLPDALSFEVESAVIRATNDKPHSARTVVLIDRWYTDILAYTHVESADKRLHKQVRTLCAARMSDFASWVLAHALCVRLINVAIPLVTCHFKVPQSAKFRATCDREVWERTCFERWEELIPKKKGMFVISTSDRKSRANELAEHILAAQPDPIS